MKNLFKNARHNWLRTSVAAVVFMATLFNVTINAEVDEATNSLQSLSLGIREAVSDEVYYPTNLYYLELCYRPADPIPRARCNGLGGNCASEVSCG